MVNIGTTMQSIYNNRAKHLRRIREGLKTNRELAQVIGIREQHIGELLKGEDGRKIGAALARRVEETFNLPKNFLDQSSFDLNEDELDDDVIEMAKTLKKLGFTNEKLLKLVEFMKI